MKNLPYHRPLSFRVKFDKFINQRSMSIDTSILLLKATYMKRPIISGIACIGIPNQGLGNERNLSFDFKEDKQFLRTITKSTGENPSIILMGRVTWDSIPNKQKYLEIHNVMVISNDYIHIMSQFPGLYGASDPQAALAWAKNHYPIIWVAGGGTIYKALLLDCEFLYLTEISRSYPADTFFPDFMNIFELKEVLQEGRSPNRAEYRKGELLDWKIKKYERVS
jgi:dihydrofolate reductase